MKVIIVGGSVAGLTLAHCLDRACIDYELLDAYPIAPHVGASIVVMVNGAKILDQLGIYDGIRDQIDPITQCNSRDSNGVKFSTSHDVAQLEEKFGYPFFIFRRQQLVQHLFDTLQDQQKIHAGSGKKVVRVEQSDQGVEVFTEDGQKYLGDLVVGCDGVHSTIRSEMWRHSHVEAPWKEPRDKATFKAQYRCLFGIAEPMEQFPIGMSEMVFGSPASFLVNAGPRGEIYFFLYEKLQKTFTWPATPRYSKADAETAAAANKNRKVLENVTFGDIWEKKKVATLQCLEEGIAEEWHYRRIALVGDAAHKMTVNSGQGGNSAIEAAAALANCLHDISHTNKTASTAEISKAFAKYQSIQKPRLEGIAKRAWLVSRTQAMDGLWTHCAVFLMRLQSAPMCSLFGKLSAKSRVVEYLPPAPRWEARGDVKSLEETTSILWKVACASAVGTLLAGLLFAKPLRF